MTECQLREYESLYAQRVELLAELNARLKGGVKSATLSTAGNSQSYTALDISELRAQIHALTLRMLELLGLTRVRTVFCQSVPNFGP